MYKYISTFSRFKQQQKNLLFYFFVSNEWKSWKKPIKKIIKTTTIIVVKIKRQKYTRNESEEYSTKEENKKMYEKISNNSTDQISNWYFVKTQKNGNKVEWIKNLKRKRKLWNNITFLYIYIPKSYGCCFLCCTFGSWKKIVSFFFKQKYVKWNVATIKSSLCLKRITML